VTVAPTWSNLIVIAPTPWGGGHCGHDQMPPHVPVTSTIGALRGLGGRTAGTQQHQANKKPTGNSHRRSRSVYWMTWSARRRSVCGIVSPSALAVFKATRESRGTISLRSSSRFPLISVYTHGPQQDAKPAGGNQSRRSLTADRDGTCVARLREQWVGTSANPLALGLSGSTSLQAESGLR
jgi:hypothetical protein